MATAVTMGQKIYTEAAACLNRHITLDATVPSDLGCAEAVTYVLKNAGVQNIPDTGIPGTAALYQFFITNPTMFTRVLAAEPGDIVISPTGQSTLGVAHGHTGIVADYGILSNDSDSGLFLEKYTETTWARYFGVANGFPIYYFRAN